MSDRAFAIYSSGCGVEEEIDRGDFVAVEMGTIRRSFHIMRLPAAINPNQSQAVLGWMLEKGCASQAINYARRLVKREK